MARVLLHRVCVCVSNRFYFTDLQCGLKPASASASVRLMSRSTPLRLTGMDTALIGVLSSSLCIVSRDADSVINCLISRISPTGGSLRGVE